MNKAQGSLEYLLLIGGAVLIAVIVIGWIVSTSLTLGGEQEVQVESQLQLLREQAFKKSAEQAVGLTVGQVEGQALQVVFFQSGVSVDGQASAEALSNAFNVVVPVSPLSREITNFTATLHSASLTFVQEDCSIEYFSNNTAGVSCICPEGTGSNCVQEILSQPGQHYAEISYNTGFLGLEEKKFTIELKTSPTTSPETMLVAPEGILSEGGNWSFENGPENLSPWVKGSEDYYNFVTDGFESEEFSSISANSDDGWFAVTRGNGSFSRTESLSSGSFELCADFFPSSSSSSASLSITGSRVSKQVTVSGPQIDYYNPEEPSVEWQTACIKNINIPSTGNYNITLQASSEQAMAWDNVELRSIKEPVIIESITYEPEPLVYPWGEGARPNLFIELKNNTSANISSVHMMSTIYVEGYEDRGVFSLEESMSVDIGPGERSTINKGQLFDILVWFYCLPASGLILPREYTLRFGVVDGDTFWGREEDIYTKDKKIYVGGACEDNIFQENKFEIVNVYTVPENPVWPWTSSADFDVVSEIRNNDIENTHRLNLFYGIKNVSYEDYLISYGNPERLSYTSKYIGPGEVYKLGLGNFNQSFIFQTMCALLSHAVPGQWLYEIKVQSDDSARYPEAVPDEAVYEFVIDGEC